MRPLTNKNRKNRIVKKKKKSGQICKKGFSNDDKNTVKFQITVITRNS